MSLDYNDIIKQGYVKVKPKSVGVWKKKWVILKKASSKGQRRLEKYQDEKSSILGQDCKVVSLVGVKQIYRLPQDNKKQAVAVLYFDGSQQQFSCDSDLEANSWVEALKEECLMSNNNILVGGSPDLLNDTPSQQVLDNTYNVYLLPSPMLDIYGECLLAVTEELILLLDVEKPSKRLVSWPLSSLRRYGRDEAKFTFEAGRHCETGEGLFIFNTTQGEKIYKCVNSATQAIVTTYRITRTQSLPDPGAPARPPPIGKSMSVGSSSPPPSAVVDLTHSNSLPATARRPQGIPPPRTTPLPPVPAGGNPAGDYDLLRSSYSGKPPEPPPPRKNSKDVTPTPSPGGSRNPSVSSEGASASASASALSPKHPTFPENTPTLAERIAQARLDLVPLSSPPPPPPMRQQSNPSDDADPIYEEKDLDPGFRKYLASRKDDKQ